MLDTKSELIRECARQAESCLYTSTSMYLWLKSIRFWSRFMIVASILIGGFAGLAVLRESFPPWVAAVLTLIAGFFPAIYESLKIKGHTDEIARAAAQFKILQDRFRQAANIIATRELSDLEDEFSKLMERMDAARAGSLTPPQRFFEAARKRIEGGDYDFSVDNKG